MSHDASAGQPAVHCEENAGQSVEQENYQVVVAHSDLAVAG